MSSGTSLALSTTLSLEPEIDFGTARLTYQPLVKKGLPVHQLALVMNLTEPAGDIE